jgi:hypothetical protein
MVKGRFRNPPPETDMAKRKQLNLKVITQAVTAAVIILIFACIGLTAKFAWTSLTGPTPSDSSQSGVQFKAEGINVELLEDVSDFRASRQARPSVPTADTRDPFHPPPTPPAPVTEQPPAAEQPPAEQPTAPEQPTQ